MRKGIELVRKSLMFGLVMVMALAMVGCSNNDTAKQDDDVQVQSEVTELGEGATSFNFQVKESDEAVTNFVIHTDETNVGEALKEVEMIEGSDSDFGMMVTVVNGVTADYNVDGKYWAFYINGEYATTGVDNTELVAGDTYMFSIEE